MTGSIGVLLPARLETRFDQRPDGHWILRVIVVPGEASVDVHDPSVDRDELARLGAAATACDGDFGGDAGAAAFESLAAELGAGRALWLVRTHVRRDAGGWQVVPTDAPAREEVVRTPATLRGLPPRLELWAEAGGADVLLKRLRPRHPDLPVEPPDTGVPKNERPRTFWASWKVLKRAGLAVRLDLTKRGIDPADISRLLVVGIGDTPPTDLFTGHAHSGQSALLSPGTPTNVTAGSGGHARPTALDLRALLADPPSTIGPSANQDLARALTGKTDGLPRVVGGDRGHRAMQSSLVQAVWPALWGHAAQDLWGPSDSWSAHQLGYWLGAYLHPQGPLPTLLVDDQPYGVLPLTPLERAADGTHPVEDRIAPGLVEALRITRSLATEERDTVIGADQERLLRVVGTTPVSTTWSWRWSLPLRIVGSGLADPDALRRTQEEVVAPMLRAAGHDPERATVPPVTIGRRHDVGLPAAEPTARPDDPATHVQWDLFMQWLDEVLGSGDPEAERLRRMLGEHGKGQPLRILLGHLWHRVRESRDRPDVISLERCLEGIGDPWPDSLLYHLAHLSLREAWRWGQWAAEGRDGPPDNDGRSLHEHSGPFPNPGAWVGDPGWAIELYGTLIDALFELAVGDHGARGDVDRAAASLVDSATHRLDPWAVAIAWRRLDERDDAARMLGLYGFVDRPFRGEPGLGDRGLVLAPSPDQAKTAAIVRDRAAAQHLAGRPDPGRWDAPLDSERVRTALRLARAVREGAHPAEAWGREYERLLPDDSVVREFRATYPAHAADAGRRTCDGLRVGQAVLAGSIEADTGYAPDAETARRFALLASAAADLADLLVLEAVHDTVTGGVSQTALALDAAAGLAAPPDFRFPMTPAGGTSLRTTVTVALPDVAPADEADPARGPADADPAVARHLEASLGDPGGPTWAWRSEAGATTSLADLGLGPADLVGVDDATLAAAVVAELGLPEGAAVEPPPRLAEARRLLRLLTDCRPPAGALPADVADRLGQRWQRLDASARALLADLRVAAGPDPDVPLDGPLGVRALRWGLRGPVGAAADRLSRHLDATAPGGDPVSDLRRLASLGSAGDSAARLVPVLVPVAPPATGPVVDTAWREVFGRVRPSLGAVPGSWRWRRHPDEDEWTGRADATGRARTADVVVDPAGATGALVTGVLDAWTETIPDREVPVTGAFSFRTPGARAPQAILLAVPTSVDDQVDNELARDVVKQAADLARARSLRPSGLGAVGALLPSAHLPAGERGGLDLPGIPQQHFSRGLHARLEPSPPEAEDLDRALRAEVADPVWMLARQWQMGEHAGENASSPVEYRLRVSNTPLLAPDGRGFADPTVQPGEVVLEGASADVQLGDAPAAGPGPDPWDDTSLWHATQLGAGADPPVQVSARDHDGGVADWWSLDLGPLDVGEEAKPFTPGDAVRRFVGLPGRMRYPGAPEPGWFSLEDPDQTVIGHMPDPSHVASLFFLDLISGHRTDWYLARLPTPPGHVLTVRSMAVRDSFGDVWRPAEWPAPADDWTTPFRTKALGPLDLLAWFATPKPLEGDVLEQVLLGVDEDADLLWAVEERTDGHDVAPPRTRVTDGSTAGSDALSTTPQVRYQVLAASPGPWHPYLAETDAGSPRRFRQGRLRVADVDGEPVDAPLPDLTSRFLPVHPPLHDIDPAGVAAGGLRLERRWVLARGRNGLPVLWQQRRRVTPRTAPAFLVGHDHSEPE